MRVLLRYTEDGDGQWLETLLEVSLYSVDQQQPRNTYSSSVITLRQHGDKVSVNVKGQGLILDFVASIGGAVASITVAAPLDVVKTRIQNANFNSQVGGMTIIKEMIKQEGVGSFFKGLTPKVGHILVHG
jgi:hypothetical protein